MKGSRTGVFVGISTSDYLQRQILDADLITVDAYSGLGIAQSVAANRISYFFDFKGPSVASDTACSSGLVALHLARRSLANGECDYAIVGAVNVIVSPLSTISFSKARMLSPDGRCKTFDKSADGYVRSEGCATLLLTREDLARRKGHRVEALIRGSAINQDGKTLSITTPNGAAQAQVLRDALKDAGLRPDDLDLIEAHGTGTAVGDEIEIGALREVFGQTRRARPLVVGAAKPHFGHLEAASGLVGAIKAVRELQTGLVPPLPFLADPVDPDAEGRIVIAESETQLGHGPQALRAGLSSFGFGGTNAHIVLEAPAEQVPRATAERPPPPVLRVLPVAGHTASTLRATAADYAAMIEADPELDLDALCRSADEVRGRHPFRRAITFADRDDALKRVRDLSVGTPRPEEASAPKPGKLALCFSGQGAQSPGMCLRLMEQDPVFGEVLRRLDRIAQAGGFPGLIDTIRDESAGADVRLSDTSTAQPALFAVGLALAQSWMARGVTPDYVLGHSLGEITAACIAGVMDEATAMRLVILRGRLMADAPGDGAMAAISGTADAVAGFAANLPPALEISGRNTARSITVSGTCEAVVLGIERAEAAGLKAVRLPVSHAFHSSLMDPVLDRLSDALEGVAFSEPRIPLVSNVTGKLVGPDTPMDAAYWVRHLRSAVEFSAAVETLLDCGVGTIAEVGPRPILLPWLRQLTGDRERAVVLRTLAGGQDDLAGLLSGLGELWTRGHAVDWSQDRRAGAGQVRLPPFRFARERFWFKTAEPEPEEPREQTPSSAALVVRKIDEGGLADILDQHRVGGRAVVPGALYLDMMTEAAKELIGPGQSFELTDCRLPQAVALSEVRGHALTVRAETLGNAGWTLVVVAPGRDGSDEKLLAHAHARFSEGTSSPHLFAHLPPETTTVAGPDLYTALEDHGLVYGPAFQGIASVESGNGLAEARFVATGAATPGAAMLDTARFDAVFHPIALALRTVDAEAAAGLWIPTGFDSLTVHGAMPEEAVVKAALLDGPHMPDLKSFDLSVHTPDGGAVISIKGLRIRRIDSRAGAALPTGPLFQTDWVPLEPSGDQVVGWTVEPLGESGDLADSLNAAGGTDGGPCVFAIDCARIGQGQDAFAALAARLRHFATSASGRPARLIAVYLDDREGQNPATEAMRAALRVFRNEVPALAATNLTLPRDLPDQRRREVVAGALALGTESDLIWKDGALAGLRLEPTVPGGRSWSPPVQGRKVQVLVPGARTGLGGLSLAPRPAIEPGPSDVLIAPRAAGLNFRDVLKTKRLYPNRPGLPLWLGDECAGVVRAVGADVKGIAPGDAVVAVAPRAFASEVVAPAAAVVRKPDALSFDEAATLPIAYSTAWYALVELARIEPGQSVLVHAGAGGVGLAALQIAGSRGARLFATAGSEEKRAYLTRLGVEAVGSSRDKSFVETIREATGGDGVDIVLSSLPGRDMIEASLDLLRPFGSYVDIGKRDIVENTGLGMRVLHKSLSLHTVDMELLFATAPGKAGRVLREVMAAVEAGDVGPLPFERFEMSEPAAAFQKMAGAGNIGKIVLGLPEEPEPAPVERSDGSVGAALITGAFGDIGLDLVDALAAAGIRAFVLVGRSAPAGASLARVEAWRASGLDVMTAQVDVADGASVVAAFDAAQAAGFDIRHVFHAAGVLADRLISDVDASDIAAAWGVKVDGAINLDAACRGREIDTFVCLSSISTLLGSPGQMAYAAANAGMEAVCARRRAAGLTGQAIVFGPWKAGLALNNAGTTDRLERLGLRSFSRADGINVLKKALTTGTPAPIAARFTMDWPGTPAPAIAQLSVCADLFPKAAGRTGMSVHGRAGILADLARATEPERPGLLSAYLRDRLASVTGQGAETMPLETPLQSLGFDSLSGLEFGMLVEEEIGAGVPLDRVDDDTSLADLAALLLSRLDLEAEIPAEAPAPPPAREEPPEPAPVGSIPAHAAPTTEDYTKNVRPDFTRNLPVLKLDADYDRAAGMTLSGVLDGTRRDVLDFVGGYGSGLFGHNHPDIVAAVTQTLTAGRPMHVQGAARPLAGRLADELAAALRDETGADYVTAFANTGAEAVEAGLKHALMDYTDRLGRVGIDLTSLPDEALEAYAPAVVAIEGSYHGKTLSALSIGHFRGWPTGRAGFRVISVPRNDPDAVARVRSRQRR
jgi:phthiocerol/phenolphthiocerol synthesis type-I polyketide synthase C